MPNRCELTTQQRTYLLGRRSHYRKCGTKAKIKAFFLLLVLALAVKLVFVDWTLLTIVHESYADEEYAAHAFALSGLMVVFALHVITLGGKVPMLDRLLAQAAAVCAVIFIVGTCFMLGAIALTQGISGISTDLSATVDAFLTGAQTVVDEELGAGVFEEIMVQLAAPLFTAAVTTAFFLTTYLLRFLVDLLIHQVPPVIQTIAETRESEALYAAIQHAEAATDDAETSLTKAQKRQDHWSVERVADVIVSLREDRLRPYDKLIAIRELSGPQPENDLPIPHPDGGPPLALPELKIRLKDIRTALSREQVLAALQHA